MTALIFQILIIAPSRPRYPLSEFETAAVKLVMRSMEKKERQKKIKKEQKEKS
jgi:hypothetical protein